MPRTFSASTDTVEYSAANIAATTAMSFCCWVKGPSVSGTTCKMLACQEDQWRISFNAEKYGGGTPTAGALYFGRSWGTTDQVTEVASPGATWANWNHVACTYDGASTTNAAKFYLNGTLLTNSFTRNAAGSIDNATGNPNVGNDNAHTLSCLAKIAFASFHSVVLTQAEILEHMIWSATGRSRFVAWDLTGDSPERDRSGNGRTGTVTGTSVTADAPPVRPGRLYVPEEWSKKVSTVTVTGASDSAWNWTFDTAGKVTALGATDSVWTWTPDSSGVITALGATDSVWTWTFDTSGIFGFFGSAAATWNWTFDSSGLIEALGASDSVWTWTPDSSGVITYLGASDSVWVWDFFTAWGSTGSSDSVWTWTPDTSGVVEALGAVDTVWVWTFDTPGELVQLAGAVTLSFAVAGDAVPPDVVLAGGTTMDFANAGDVTVAVPVNIAGAITLAFEVDGTMTLFVAGRGPTEFAAGGSARSPGSASSGTSGYRGAGSSVTAGTKRSSPGAFN